MSTYDLRLQGAIDATSVAKDAGGTDDLRATLIEELEQRGLDELEEGSDALANEAAIEFERAISVMRAQLAVPAQDPTAGAAEVSPAG